MTNALIFPTMNNKHGQQPGWAWLVEDRRAGNVLTASFLVSLGEQVTESSTKESVLQTEYKTSGQPQVPPPPTHTCSLHSSAAANMTKTITPSQPPSLLHQIPKPCSFPGHKNTAAASSVDQLNILICQEQIEPFWPRSKGCSTGPVQQSNAGLAGLSQEPWGCLFQCQSPCCPHTAKISRTALSTTKQLILHKLNLAKMLNVMQWDTEMAALAK